MNVIAKLFVRDVKTIWRDSFVIWGVVTPFLMALIVRLVVFLVERNSFPGALSSLYPVLIATTLFLMPQMALGTAGGFMILEDKDQGVLTALNVTPLRVSVYLSYKLTFLTLLSAMTVTLSIPLCGLLPFKPVMILVALCSALLVPFTALFISAFAGNKVEGLAMMKASGFFMMAPVASFFFSSGWQYAFGILPTYWTLKAFEFSAESDPLIVPYLMIGFAFTGLFILGMARIFSRKI